MSGPRMYREGEPLLDDDFQPCICSICKRPILVGEPRYTAGEPDTYRHYACHSKRVENFKAAGRRLKDSLRSAAEALDELRVRTDGARRQR